MASIKQSINAVTPQGTAVEMFKILDDMRKDLEALTTSFNQLRTDYNANATIGADTTAAAVTLKTTA